MSEQALRAPSDLVGVVCLWLGSFVCGACLHAAPRVPAAAGLLVAMARPPRRVYKYCVGCAALATLLWRSQAWFLFSIASYAAAFFTIVNKWLDIGLGRTEVVVRVGDNSVGTSSTASSSSAIVQPGGAATRKQKVIEWCEFRQEGSLCSTATGGSSTSNGNCTGGGHPNCKWFPRDAPVAVIFSDRLVKSGMVTMTSLCRHPTTLYVLVLMQVTSTYTPIPTEFLSCRTISMTMLDGLQYLRDTGWKPDSICDGPGRDTLGKVTQPTLLGAAHWDKDPKHASCANHLRFYLTEFPILAHHERILFVDDDVVIQQDSMKLYSHKTKPGVVFTANCDVNLWNGKCQRFDVGRSVYEHFFSQAVIPDGAWERVLALLKEASEGTISYDPKHFEWNFGFVSAPAALVVVQPRKGYSAYPVSPPRRCQHAISIPRCCSLRSAHTFESLPPLSLSLSSELDVARRLPSNQHGSDVRALGEQYAVDAIHQRRLSRIRPWHPLPRLRRTHRVLSAQRLVRARELRMRASAPR